MTGNSCDEALPLVENKDVVAADPVAESTVHPQ